MRYTDWIITMFLRLIKKEIRVISKEVYIPFWNTKPFVISVSKSNLWLFIFNWFLSGWNRCWWFRIMQQRDPSAFWFEWRHLFKRKWSVSHQMAGILGKMQSLISIGSFFSLAMSKFIIFDEEPKTVLLFEWSCLQPFLNWNSPVQIISTSIQESKKMSRLFIIRNTEDPHIIQQFLLETPAFRRQLFSKYSFLNKEYSLNASHRNPLDKSWSPFSYLSFVFTSLISSFLPTRTNFGGFSWMEIIQSCVVVSTVVLLP